VVTNPSAMARKNQNQSRFGFLLFFPTARSPRLSRRFPHAGRRQSFRGLIRSARRGSVMLRQNLIFMDRSERRNPLGRLVSFARMSFMQPEELYRAG
jgi:hypothetical protein